MLAGREGREKFGSSIGRKKKKMGGLTEREKQKRKAMWVLNSSFAPDVAQSPPSLTQAHCRKGQSAQAEDRDHEKAQDVQEELQRTHMMMRLGLVQFFLASLLSL